MKEIFRNELIVNARGDTKTILPLPKDLTTPPENTLTFPDKKETHIDWRRTFDRITEMGKVVEAQEIVQDEGTFRVPLSHPEIKYAVGFVFADAHIGSLSSDHELIRDMLETVLFTPNAFLIDAGDTFDNGIWGGLSHEGAIPPYLQTFVVEDIIREFGEKYAACVVGNHAEWSFNTAGVKPEGMFARAMNGPVFAGMGLLHLEAGKQKYDWAIAHKYWGQSKKNIFNVCVNLRQNEYPDADIFTVAHNHTWGYMSEQVDGRKRLYLRPGTAKTSDRYARLHGIARRGQEMGLAVVLGTEEKSFSAFSIEEAVSLQLVRKKIAEIEG